MSFVEFLMEYYFYILAVLVILIVGVIGFLVDSKNKEKKRKVNENVNNNVDANVQSQMENNVVASDAASGNVNTGVDAVMPVMEDVQKNDSLMNSFQSIQPEIPGNVAMQSTNVNEVNGIQNMQPEMSSVAVNQQPVMNANLENGVPGSLSDVNMVNGLQDVQPVMPAMDVNPIPVVPVQTSSDITNNSIQGNVIGVQGMQPQISNMPINTVPVQPVQPQVNAGVIEVPVSNVNTGVDMVSTLDTTPIMNNGQAVQSPLQTINVDPMPVSVGQNLTNLNSGMGSNGQVQNNIEMNQGGVPNTSQAGVVPNGNFQNSNVGIQTGNTNNLQGNNPVLSSDNSQPFDISSMFANNQ